MAGISLLFFFFLFGKREFSYWEIFYDSRRNIDRSIQRGGFFVSIRLSRQKFVLIVSFISFRFESWGRFSEIPKSTFKLITRNSHELTSRQISRVKRRTLAKRSKFRDHLKYKREIRTRNFIIRDFGTFNWTDGRIDWFDSVSLELLFFFFFYHRITNFEMINIRNDYQYFSRTLKLTSKSLPKNWTRNTWNLKIRFIVFIPRNKIISNAKYLLRAMVTAMGNDKPLWTIQRLI